MSSLQPVSTLQALTSLEVDYWHDVDHNWGRTAHTFYVEDGVFVIGDKTMAGQQAIVEFYRWREGRGARTARHVVSNFRLSSWKENVAELECVMCLYAADGPPVRESKPAIMIADIQSVCKLVDSSWRYMSHRLTPIFMGGEAPTIPPQ
jgi:hypothetical protein